MDGTPYLLLMLALLVGVWWLDRNRRRLVRRARAKGDQWADEITARQRADHLPEALDAMGRSLVLKAEHASAVALVNQVVRSKRAYRQAGPELWHLDFGAADDLVASTYAAHEGTEVVLVSLRERMGVLGAAMWAQFLERLEKAAGEQGVAVEHRSGVGCEARPGPDGDRVWWRT